MPGTVSTNTRAGHLAEDFGRLILRSIAAVAPIEPADDFGIDAIATLLEPDPNTHLRQLYI